MMDDADHARRIAFEVDYWKALLDDLAALNTAIKLSAGHVLDASVHYVTLGVATLPGGGNLAEQGLRACRQATDELQEAQAALQRMIELARGRAAAMGVELAELEGE